MKRKFLEVLILVLTVSAHKAVALPVVGRPTLAPATQSSSSPTSSQAIRQETLENFENLIGHPLTSSELNQIQRVSDQTYALNQDETPQKVRWDLGKSGYEFTVLICGQFKMQADAIIPQKVKDIMGKLPAAVQAKANGVMNAASAELMPCFDPHTGVSYVMVGGSHTIGAPSILSAGLTIGLYFSPKADKMVVGNYVFGRFTWNVGAFGKWDITGGGDLQCAENLPKMEFDFSKCRRFFLSTGLGFDFGGAIFSKLKALRKQADATVAVAGNAGPLTIDLGMWSFSYGVIVKIHEFPWYERMRKGMGLKETFNDIAQYTTTTAAN